MSSAATATLIPLEAVDPAMIEAVLDRAFGPDRHARTAYRIREGMDWLPGLSLAALDEDDKGFAEEVRKSIFTFAHIPDRMSAIDVPKITRDVDQETLAKVISGAVAESDIRSVDFILSNISNRMSDSLREMSADMGEVKPTDAQAAMSTVVRAIRALADSGEIALTMPSENDD